MLPVASPLPVLSIRTDPRFASTRSLRRASLLSSVVSVSTPLPRQCPGLLARASAVSRIFTLETARNGRRSFASCLRKTEARPEWLYLTHVERNEVLMNEAIEIARLGMFVDLDVMKEDLAKW